MLDQHMPSANANVSLLSITFYKADGFQDQFYQPFNLHVTPDTIKSLSTVINDTSGASFTPITVAAAAANTLILGNATSVVPIPNGWAAPRLMFLLEVESISIGGVAEIYEVQGWTDYYDPSISQTLARDALLTTNNIIVKQSITVPNKAAPIVQTKTSDQCLTNSNLHNQNVSNVPVDSVYSVTPVDSIIPLAAEYLNIGEHLPNYDHTVELPANLLTSNITPSTRNALSPAGWLSTTLNAHVNTMNSTLNTIQAVDGGSLSVMQEVDNVFSGTVSLLNTASTAIGNNAFLTLLYNNTGSTNAVFTWGDLLDIDPTIESRSKLFTSQNHEIVASEYLTNTDVCSMAAALAQPILSSILHRLALKSISIECNNLELTSPQVVIIAATPMSGILTQYVINSLETALYGEFMPIVTRNYTTLVMMTIVADILTGSTIDVSVNHDPITRYCRPAYADSITSPVVSNYPMEEMHVGMGQILDKTGVTHNISQAVSAAQIYDGPGAVDAIADTIVPHHHIY